MQLVPDYISRKTTNLQSIVPLTHVSEIPSVYNLFPPGHRLYFPDYSESGLWLVHLESMKMAEEEAFVQSAGTVRREFLEPAQRFHGI